MSKPSCNIPFTGPEPRVSFIEFLINNIFLIVYVSKLQFDSILWQESKAETHKTSRINDVLMHYIFHSEKSSSSSVCLYDHLLDGEEIEK